MAVQRTPEPYVLADYIDIACRLLEQRGHARESLLAGTGIPPAVLAEGNVRIPWTQFARFVRRALALTGDETLGLQFGMAMNIKTHGFLGYAALSSRTLGEAIELAVRYYRTRSTLLDLHFFVEGETAVLQFDERVPLGDLLPFAIDSAFASFFVIRTQLIAGPVPPGETRLAFEGQAHHQRLRDLFGDTLHFGCAFNQLRFPASELGRALDYADPQLVRMAASQCEEDLKKLRDEGGLLGEVRRCVRRDLATSPALEDVASLMHLSPRTLRRRLADLGTTFQDIVDQMRRGLALEYLADPARPVEEIAESLGYADPSNFGRAFRRWTGMSPSAWRAR